VFWTGQSGFITVLALNGSAEAGATSQIKIATPKLALNSRIQNLSAAKLPCTIEVPSLAARRFSHQEAPVPR
jgi:hypothetical protein